MDAKPFLKWAGGKSRLLPQFEPLFPKRFDDYYEPFVGSAAVYFHLCNLKSAGGLNQSMTGARLSDSNSELINCYITLRDHINELVELLFEHKKKHSKQYYYRIRGQDPKSLSHLQRAARLIYLNKTCFNGLYRVNSKGEFNVPIGSYKNPAIADPKTLVKAHLALQGVHLSTSKFSEVLQHAKAGDFVYFDPPYHPVSITSNFTSYTNEEFGERQQSELRDVVRELTTRGCMVMVSNSDAPFVWKLYGDFRQRHVHASRLINSNSDGRGKITELVITNY